MIVWVNTREWNPEDYISVLIAYIRKDDPTHLCYGIGWHCKAEDDEDKDTWWLTEPFTMDIYPHGYNENIKVLYWTLLPELPKE